VGLISLPSGRRQHSQRLCGKRTSSPSALLKQAFEILPCCDDLGLAIHAPEPPQAETSHAVPLFPLREQWFDPDFPLVHSFLVGRCLMVPLHPLLIIRKKRTMDVPTTLAGSTVQLQWACITCASSRTVFHQLCLLFSMKPKQRLPLRTAILIMDSVVRELSWSIIGCLVFPIGWDIGPNVCVFDSLDVLKRSIFGIESRRVWAAHASENRRTRVNHAWADCPSLPLARPALPE